MKLIIYDPYNITIDDVDISTFHYYGPTEGYDHNNSKSSGYISFKVNLPYEHRRDIIDLRNNIQDALKWKVNKNEYVKVHFSDDLERPTISIRLDSGSRGLINPPEFCFKL